MAKTKFTKPKGRMKKAPKLEKEHEKEALAWINEKIWKKAKRAVGHVPFTTDLVAAYFCTIDTRASAPARPRLALLAAIIYFIFPADAVPDFLPLFGYTDDAAIFTAAIGTFGAYVQDSHYEKANEKLAELGIKSKD